VSFLSRRSKSEEGANILPQFLAWRELAVTASNRTHTFRLYQKHHHAVRARFKNKIPFFLSFDGDGAIDF
jgi:hypothetical protein